MSYKKKDLEIVYSLSWKNGPKRDDKKQLSIVAVCDIPSTTLNFDVFKSYLLKNSGTTEDDVRVSYVMDNGGEYPIQSQTDFQVALYTFRRKARAGEIIDLLLERISEQKTHRNLRHSNDVETQSENMELHSLASTIEAPPEWFIAGLAQLKKELKEEVTADVTNIVANAVSELKSKPNCPCNSRLSHKSEKRLKRIASHGCESSFDTKDLIKSLKLESKLDKLERKASKYREKRLALHHHGHKKSEMGPKSSDSEAGPSTSRKKEEKRKTEEQKARQEPKMDARPVNVQKFIPHLLGGEVYLHQWEVQNTGQEQWTSQTQLQYTWGSKKLVPSEKVIAVPFLKPGEKGHVSVRLHIPPHTGKYECYWQFTHKGFRFGHWLGVQVIVDPFDLKGHPSVLEKTTPNDQEYNFNRESEVEDFEKFLQGPDSEVPKKTAEHFKAAEALASVYNSKQNDPKPSAPTENTDQLVKEVSKSFEQLYLDVAKPDGAKKFNLEEFDSDCSWSSGSTGTYNLEDRVASILNAPNFKHQLKNAEEPVLIPLPKCFVLEDQKPKEQEQAAAPNNFDDNNNTENVSEASGSSIKLRDEDLDNIVVITVPKDDQVREGFIYVHVDGQKVLIPKNILKSEVVTAAQELERSPSAANSVGVIIDECHSNKSPTPSVASTVQPQPKTEENASGSAPVDLSSSSRGNVEYCTPLEEGADRSNYFEANNYMSHCSAAGSCYSEVNSSAERQNRVFVFPQGVPGYEVIYPTLDLNDPSCPNLTSQVFVPPAHYNIPEQQPQVNPFVEAVPNFQQTPPEQRRAPLEDPLLYAPPPRVEVPQQPQRVYGEEPQVRRNPKSSQVHILPETLVNGAVNVASSAINTARSVINMIKPETPGRWVNGHWVSSGPQTPREANLQALADMGFWNRDLNATLLARFNDDLNRTVAELVS